MKNKRLISALLCAVLMLALVACGGSETETTESGELEVVRLIASSDVSVVSEYAVEPMKERGYDLQVTIVDDYVVPNQAVFEGDADCNLFQHEVYMKTFNDENNADLVAIQPAIFDNPYAIYSSKIDSLEEVEDGMQVIVSDAPSNQERSLNVLKEAGLITLADEPKEEYLGIVDIVENPYNLEIVAMDQLSIWSMLEDTDFVVWPSVSVASIDPEAADTDLFRVTEDKYCHIISVKAGNEDAEWVKALLEVYSLPEFEEMLQEEYAGAVHALLLEN